MDTEDEIIKPSTRKPERDLLVEAKWVLGITIAFWLAAIIWQQLSPKTNGNLAEIGNFYGGILGPLTSLAAVIMVFITLRVQKKELESTKEELAQNRITTEQQNQAIRRQVFEQSFFSLLKKYRDLVEARPSEELESQFYSIFNQDRLDELATKHLAGQKWPPTWYKERANLGGSAAPMLTELQSAWKEMYESNSSYFFTVFQALHQLLFWIDSQPESVIGDREKRQFVQIVKIYAAPIEHLNLLLYLRSRINRHLPRLVNKYRFLDQLVSTSILALPRNYPVLFFTQYISLQDHLQADDPFLIKDEQAFGRSMAWSSPAGAFVPFDDIDPMAL